MTCPDNPDQFTQKTIEKTREQGKERLSYRPFIIVALLNIFLFYQRLENVIIEKTYNILEEIENNIHLPISSYAQNIIEFVTPKANIIINIVLVLLIFTTTLSVAIDIYIILSTRTARETE